MLNGPSSKPIAAPTLSSLCIDTKASAALRSKSSAKTSECADVKLHGNGCGYGIRPEIMG